MKMAKVDPGKVRVTGEPLNSKQLFENEPAVFKIDCSDAGAGLVGVELKTHEGKPIEDVKVEDSGEGEGIYKVTFVPRKAGSVVSAKVYFDKRDVPGR